MGWIDEHPRVRQVDEAIVDLQQAAAKWQARIATTSEQHEQALKEWAKACESAAWEGTDPPPKPEEPDVLADRQERAFYWIRRGDELRAQRSQVVATLEPEWTAQAHEREAALLAKARPALEELARIGQALDGLLEEQREIVTAARGGVPQYRTVGHNGRNPVAERIDWHARMGPDEILKAVIAGRGPIIRLDEIYAANEAAMQGRAQ